MQYDDLEVVGHLYDAALGHVGWVDASARVSALVDGATLTFTARPSADAGVDIIDMRGVHLEGGRAVRSALHRGRSVDQRRPGAAARQPFRRQLRSGQRPGVGKQPHLQRALSAEHGCLSRGDVDGHVPGRRPVCPGHPPTATVTPFRGRSGASARPPHVARPLGPSPAIQAAAGRRRHQRWRRDVGPLALRGASSLPLRGASSARTVPPSRSSGPMTDCRWSDLACMRPSGPAGCHQGCCGCYGWRVRLRQREWSPAHTATVGATSL